MESAAGGNILFMRRDGIPRAREENIPAQINLTDNGARIFSASAEFNPDA
jgi:hypothetical protein